MPSLTQQDLQAAAPRVLARLRAKADLPPHGTVAGQSVASMFLEELGHGVRGPVNDIDVFVSLGMPRTMRGLNELDPTQPYKQPHRKQTTNIQFTDISEGSSSYEHVKFIALRSSISIKRTYQVGLVNYTLIDSPLIPHAAPDHGDEVSQGVVDGFDLNLVGVGINLDTGTVVCSPGFLEFLATSRIRVETCNTPAHTMMRLAKKVLGGQILGASCDFAAERKMLETALYCQQVNDAQTNAEYKLYSAMSFGGRYKKVHEQYADVLPPVIPREETLPDGTVYTFYDMVVAEPELAEDQRIAGWGAGETKLPYSLSQHMLVAKFPQVYDLLHPERSILPPEEFARRRAALDMIDPAEKAPRNMHYLQQALGRPSVQLEVPGYDEYGAAVFFFNQNCASNPVLAQQAVDVLDSVREIEGHVLYNCDIRADEVLGLGVDRAHAWKQILASHGSKVMSLVAYYGQSPEHHASKAAFLRELVGWLDEMGPRGRGIFEEVVPALGAACGNGSMLRPLLECFPQSQRETMATALVHRVVPAWPDLSREDPQTCANMLRLWADVDMSIPAQAWETIHPRAWSRLMHGMLINAPVYKLAEDPSTRDMLWRAFEHLSADDLAADQARLLRGLLRQQSQRDLGLREKLLQRADLPALLPVCNAVLDYLTARQAEDDGFPIPFGHNDAEDPWQDFFRPAATIALLQEVVMQAQVQAPSASTRRGMRL